MKPYVEAAPVGFVRYSMLQGETQSQSLTLYSEEDEPFQITNIESPDEWVKVTSTKVTDEKQRVAAGKADQNQYKLDIVVGGLDARVGPLAEKIHILTNSKHQPDYWISVAGVIRPTVRIDPQTVNFGEVAPKDSAATRLVYVRSSSLTAPDALKITKAETNVPGVTASFKPTPNKGEFEVTLQVAADAKPGDVQGDLKVYTNDKVNPIITVPVKGTVKSAVAAAGTKSK